MSELLEQYECVKNVADPNNIQKFSLNNRGCWCRVTNVYDGDSINGIIKTEMGFHNFSIRLNGIDACEIRSKHPELKRLAKNSRSKLQELIGFENANKPCIVWLICRQNDKYGRIMADVRIMPSDAERIQDILLNQGHAYEYHGGKRKTEDEQLEYFRNFRV